MFAYVGLPQNLKDLKDLDTRQHTKTFSKKHSHTAANLKIETLGNGGETPEKGEGGGASIDGRRGEEVKNQKGTAERQRRSQVVM